MLARLALSAVCRLTPLAPEEVADLKLAITEAANDYVDATIGLRGREPAATSRSTSTTTGSTGPERTAGPVASVRAAS